MYKFCIRAPRDTRVALALDKENKNDLWNETIKKVVTRIIELQVFQTTTPDGKTSTWASESPMPCDN